MSLQIQGPTNQTHQQKIFYAKRKIRQQIFITPTTISSENKSFS